MLDNWKYSESCDTTHDFGSGKYHIKFAYWHKRVVHEIYHTTIMLIFELYFAFCFQQDTRVIPSANAGWKTLPIQSLDIPISCASVGLLRNNSLRAMGFL